MARVRDFFAQRGEEANNTQRGESPPEAKQPVQEATPEENHSDVQSFSAESNKAEGSPFVAEYLGTGNTPTFDVLHGSTAAHDCTSNSEPEKSESLHLADTASLTGVESAANTRDNPLHPNYDYAPAECQNINKAVFKAEENSQGISYECIGNITAEPADSAISAMSSESPVSTAASFTFGTVVAPLYHQVYGRVGSESHNTGDWGNPAQATLNVREFIQNHPHTDGQETSCTVPTQDNRDKVQGTVIKTQESKQETLSNTLKSPPTEEETRLSVTENDFLEPPEFLQDPGVNSDQECTDTSVVPKTILEDKVVFQHTVTIKNGDLPNTQKAPKSLHLQRGAQEEDVTHDLKQQTTAQHQQPEQPCIQWKTNLHEARAGSEKEFMTSLHTLMSFTSPQPSQRALEHVSDEPNQQTSSSRSNGYECVSQTSHEGNLDAEEENKEAMRNICIHNELKDKSSSKYEETAHQEIKTVASKQEDTAEVKNWEMMVEEDEKNMLTDEEDNQAMSSNAEEKDQGEQLEDVGVETVSENKDATEMGKKKPDEKMAGKITEDKAKDAVSVQHKEWIGQEQNEETPAVKYTKAEKELGNVEATMSAGEEEQAEEPEVKENKEQEKTEAESEKVITEKLNAEKEKDEIEGEKEIEIDINNDDKAGVILEEYEEKNPDYKEELVVNETSLNVDSELESMKIKYKEQELGCFGERLDITQKEAEVESSVLPNDVQDKTGGDTVNAGEGQDAHMTSDLHLYQEEALYDNVNVTHELKETARDGTKSLAAEGGSCLLSDEPEGDQLGQDSTSAESDSEDEVELYMHCLRAVHTGAQAQKDRNRETAFSGGFSGSRSKLLSTPMPSISESLDEEQPLSCLQDNQEDTDTPHIQIIAAALQASTDQGSVSKTLSRWKETFSCSNIIKTLVFGTLLVLFGAVAYYYDFLACLGLYVISVIWLCCQGESQPVKNQRMG